MDVHVSPTEAFPGGSSWGRTTGLMCNRVSKGARQPRAETLGHLCAQDFNSKSQCHLEPGAPERWCFELSQGEAANAKTGSLIFLLSAACKKIKSMPNGPKHFLVALKCKIELIPFWCLNKYSWYFYADLEALKLLELPSQTESDVRNKRKGKCIYWS